MILIQLGNWRFFSNFEVGETVTYRDLLLGAILPSGADATRALANNLCGSQEAFVEKMNECAKKLKLKDTHFVNTTGIHDDNHYTTVHDMALIVQYAVANPTLKKYIQNVMLPLLTDYING